MKAEKAEKYKEFKKSDNKKMFEEWFLNYKPDDIKTGKENIKTKHTTIKKRKKRQTKTAKFFNIYGTKTRKNKKSLY